MTCEQYWGEGIERVERGEPDAHRAGCVDCRRAHDARRQLVDVLPLVGALVPDDPQWQARVWSRIARERARRHMWRCAGGALAAVVATTVFWLAIGHRADPPSIAMPSSGAVPSSVAVPSSADLPHDADPDRAAGVSKRLAQIEIISGPVAMRSTSARVGDRVRISAGPGDEVRVYRADRLMLRCADSASAPACVRGASGMVAEATLETAGPYQLVVIEAARLPPKVLEPTGALTTDLAALVPVNGVYQLTDLRVR